MSLLNIYSQSKRFTCTLCDCIVTCADQSLSITLTYAKRKKKSVFHKAKLWFHMVNSLFSHALIYFFSAPPNCCLGLRLRHFLEKRLSFYLILHKKLFNWHNLQKLCHMYRYFFHFLFIDTNSITHSNALNHWCSALKAYLALYNIT